MDSPNAVLTQAVSSVESRLTKAWPVVDESITKSAKESISSGAAVGMSVDAAVGAAVAVAIGFRCTRAGNDRCEDRDEGDGQAG